MLKPITPELPEAFTTRVFSVTQGQVFFGVCVTRSPTAPLSLMKLWGWAGIHSIIPLSLMETAHRLVPNGVLLHVLHIFKENLQCPIQQNQWGHHRVRKSQLASSVVSPKSFQLSPCNLSHWLLSHRAFLSFPSIAAPSHSHIKIRSWPQGRWDFSIAIPPQNLWIQFITPEEHFSSPQRTPSPGTFPD